MITSSGRRADPGETGGRRTQTAQSPHVNRTIAEKFG